MTKAVIIAEITGHIRRCGGRNPDWYVGIAADARDRLFSGHGVREKGDSWIYREAENSAVARDIEYYFLSQRMDGGPGGGNGDCRCVYAYKKTASTRE